MKIREKDKEGIILELENRYQAIEKRQERLRQKIDEVIEAIRSSRLPEK